MNDPVLTACAVVAALCLFICYASYLLWQKLISTEPNCFQRCLEEEAIGILFIIAAGGVIVSFSVGAARLDGWLL
jgi:hypothetical protein